MLESYDPIDLHDGRTQAEHDIDIARRISPAEDIKRWLPDAPTVKLAEGIMESHPRVESIVVPMVQPGKQRGIWTTGQEFFTVRGALFLTGSIGAGFMSYEAARNRASEVAKAALAVTHREGTTGYAVIERDGFQAVFEDF